MFRPRVIPILLLSNTGLVKTVKFKNPRYIGDPINAVRIFNDKEADELVFLDINATKQNKKISLELLEKIADEAFMPFSVGGGIKTINDIKEILNVGAEKVVINSYAVENPLFIKEASEIFGSSTIIVSIDVKKKMFGGYGVYTVSGNKSTKLSPVHWAQEVAQLGAGEIMITSIDKEGTMEGYDLELIKKIANSVDIPVIASGGAGKLSDFTSAVFEANASAVSAGSMFVYHGRRRAVLINYPEQDELKELFSKFGI